MRLAVCILLIALMPTPLAAQQIDASAKLNGIPAGITVNARGSVPVTSWLEFVPFVSVPPGNRETTQGSMLDAKAFAQAAREAGVAADQLTVSPGAESSFAEGNPSGAVVTVTAQPDVFAKLRAIARRHGLAASEQAAEYVPADTGTLYRRALEIAIDNAREIAQGIAAADHQHVGRLLNFVSEPFESARQLTRGASPSETRYAAESQEGMVTASGIATLALRP